MSPRTTGARRRAASLKTLTLKTKTLTFRTLALALLVLALCAPAALSQKGARRGQTRPRRRPDVAFIPTPPDTVDEMLRQARLGPEDVLYDLGSGDGRIPIRAAAVYGVRAVGIEIDPALVAQAQESARRTGVSHLVAFRTGDIYREDLRGATVVTLYLSDTINLSLRPKLLRELPAGARIVSHDFRMGDWKPERTVRVPWRNLYRTVYVWTVPPDGRINK